MFEPSRALSTFLLVLCLAAPAAGQEPPAATPEPTPAPPAAAPDMSGPGGTPSVPTQQPPVTEGEAPPATAVPAGAAAPGTAAPGTAPPATATPGAPAAPAAPVPAAPPGIPGAGPDRLEFDIKFPADQGGGSAVGSAGDLAYERETTAVLTGGVKLRYQDIEIQADQVSLDQKTKLVTASGSVILDQGPRRLTGDTLDFDLNTKTGKLKNATGQVAPDYYFRGAEVAKTGDDTYTVTDGIFTSCSQEVPDWSFRLGEARVEVEGYAHVRHASLRAKKLPVFYTPYILWPVKSDRTSGLLIPNVGFSDTRGASLGLAYYQVLGRSYDTTFHVDTYTQGYLGLGNEFRYHPTEGTQGAVLGYAVQDPESSDDSWRWKAEWNHTTTDLPWGMRGVVQYQDFSDFEFFRDFERDFDRNTLRFIDSRAFVTGNWGPHLLNLLLNQRQTFVGQGIAQGKNDTVEQTKLPELEYRLRSTRIGGSPFYAQFDGSASFLSIDRPGTGAGNYSGSYGRVDLFPQVTLPVRSFPWLNLSVGGGGRLTWYGDTLDATTQDRFDGESLTRALPFASAQVVGPSFSRIFDGGVGGMGGFSKFKHVFEPRITYNFLGDFEEQREIPLFDEVDGTRSSNFGRVALVNRLLGKPASELGSAREILSFELARRYSFDDTQPLQQGQEGGLRVETQEGPLEALLRFNPSDKTSLKAEATYSTLFSGLDSTSFSGNLGFGVGNFLGLTWFTNYQPQTGEAVSDQVRFNGSVEVWPSKLRLEAQVNYDVKESFLQQQIFVANWTSQCYGLRLELREFRSLIGPRFSDKDFRFSLTLKNVGTFLDLTSRSSASEP